MPCRILKGAPVAEALSIELSERVRALGERGVVPCLGMIRIGERAGDLSYERSASKRCEALGIAIRKRLLDESVTEQELLAVIAEMNADDTVHGILFFRPLPEGMDMRAICDAIAPEKDVDGFTPVNVGKMLIGEECFLPCTPHGIIKLIEVTGMDLAGKHAVVIGRSNIVGKPVAVLLSRKSVNATVTLCHTGTRDVGSFTRTADVVVVAAGRPNTLTGDMLKPGAVVIDVGVNRVPDATKPKGYRLCGDADFESCAAVASAITPVPGGVGPMTITMLLWNTLESARNASRVA